MQPNTIVHLSIRHTADLPVAGLSPGLRWMDYDSTSKLQSESALQLLSHIRTLRLALAIAVVATSAMATRNLLFSSSRVSSSEMAPSKVQSRRIRITLELVFGIDWRWRTLQLQHRQPCQGLEGLCPTSLTISSLQVDKP